MVSCRQGFNLHPWVVVNIGLDHLAINFDGLRVQVLMFLCMYHITCFLFAKYTTYQPKVKGVHRIL